MSNTSRSKAPRRSIPRQATGKARVSKEPSPLDAHLGYWLRFVSNHVSYAFKAKVEQEGVTVAEWVIMRALFSEEGVRPSDLAEKVGLTRGAVSKLVERLVKKTLIECREDELDGRAQVVTLSRSGRKLVPKLAALADQNDAEMFRHLDSKQQKQLRSLLQSFVEFHGLENVPID